MLKKKKTNKNSIEAAAVPTPKVESFPVCVFNTHHHVAKSKGREREGEKGEEEEQEEGRGWGRGAFFYFIISSGCVHLQTASGWNPKDIYIWTSVVLTTV